MVQKLRRVTRKKSFEVWSQSLSAVEFDKKIDKNLFYLKLATKVTQYKRNALRRLQGLLK